MPEIQPWKSRSLSECCSCSLSGTVPPPVQQRGSSSPVTSLMPGGTAAEQQPDVNPVPSSHSLDDCTYCLNNDHTHLFELRRSIQAQVHINANNRVGCLFFYPDPTNLKHSGSGAFIYHFSPVVGNETDNPKLQRRLCSKPTSVSQRNPLLVAKELLRYFMHRACYVVTPRSAEEISGVTSVRPSPAAPVPPRIIRNAPCCGH